MTKQILENSKKILVLTPSWVGDAVMSLPSVKRLSEICPSSQIDILCKPFVKDVFINNPLIKNIFEINSNHWKNKVREQAYDSTILLPNSFRSALILNQLNIKNRIGYPSEFRRFLLTQPIKLKKDLKQKHHAYYYMNLIDGNYNEKPVAEIHVSDEEKKAAQKMLEKKDIPKGKWIVGIVPGAQNSRAKQWFPERFALLSDILTKTYKAKIVIFGNKAERKLAENVADLMEADSINFAGETTLRETIGLMSLCSIFVSNDTGGMHLAAACGKPVVALFGPTEDWNTSPLGENHLIIRQPVPCSPCMLRDCPIDHRCFRLLTVDRVRREMEHWLYTIPPEFQPN